MRRNASPTWPPEASRASSTERGRRVQRDTRRGLRDSGRTRHIHALRSFWRFLLQSDLALTNPCGRLSMPHREKPIPHYLTT